MKVDDIAGIIERHDQESGGLISLLEAIQSKYSYLPEEALKLVAQETGRPLVDIYGVATFYRAFSLKPRGKHLLSVCLGTACHVRNAPTIAGEVEKHLGIKPGQTTPNKEFTFETVNCLGACALGPVIVVDGHYFPQVKAANVKKILDRARAGFDGIEGPGDPRVFAVEVNCPRCNHSLIDHTHLIDSHPAIRVTASYGQLHGWLRLSSLYGRPPVKYEHLIPRGAVIDIFCPHCHAELTSASRCMECDAPMIGMIVKNGGVLQLCSRRGCGGHSLDLTGVNV
jgi:NADH:ubiquinone oxidoreductase subunit E